MKNLDDIPKRSIETLAQYVTVSYYSYIGCSNAPVKNRQAEAQMIAAITAHGNRSGYVVEILYTADEIESMIEHGHQDDRQKAMGHDRDRADRFCRKWNALFGYK